MAMSWSVIQPCLGNVKLRAHVITKLVIFLYIFINKCKIMYTHTYIQVYMYTYIHTHIHTYIGVIYLFTYKYRETGRKTG